jgi:hypothetical protein
VFTQRNAFDVLRGDETRIAVVAKFVDGQNIRMIERRNGAGFLCEALHSFRISRDFGGQKLDSHSAFQLAGVLREIHFTHATRADFGEDAVVSECGVGRDGHLSIADLCPGCFDE